MVNRIFLVFFCILSLIMGPSRAQSIPALSLNLKKPQKFEEKKLGSEKTDEKKFTLPRRFIQNTVTKFNWNFNASEKLREVLERAKLAHRDDYTKLLSFYNYSLDETASQKIELDSVIYKANAGILLHDLRNSWIDNLYMLMGEAYYFRKQFDTAYLTFQYINYAFAPKEKDGYDKPIGSNADEDGGNAFTVSSPEKSRLSQIFWNKPPSRNESFLWQIRTYIAGEAFAEAGGLIETLRHDPQFPERLEPQLDEVQALWFYRQQLNDSAAVYLEKALPTAADREEKARWLYLIGQLYEKSGRHQQARDFYEKAVHVTLNPVLEVYGRLNAIRQNKGDEKALEDNLDALRKMARKDRYINYRDIIYYAAAQMELERNDTTAATNFLLLSTRREPGVESADPLQKSRSFLLLAALSYQQGKYTDAHRFYDSVSNPELAADPDQLENLRSGLKDIAGWEEVINRQDSLQKVAAMPEADREKYVRRLLKQLRKQRGLKEEDENITAGGNGFTDPNAPAVPDLFGGNAKGAWYFDNPDLKAKGQAQFRSRWGNRPNVDNWQRIAIVKQTIAAARDNAADAQAGNQPPATGTAVMELSFEGLMSRLPLTADQLKISNDSIADARWLIGKTLLDGLENYAGAAREYEEFLHRFPGHPREAEVMMRLYYCYLKLGLSGDARRILDNLHSKYPDSPVTERLLHPDAVASADSLKAAMTLAYDHIYTLFIEGNFKEALDAKQKADSLYSSNYWTPQLLYIQSVYYIKQREDDSAKKVLQDIIRLYGSSPMAERAKLMLDVLGRRKQIEEHLASLQIERPREDSVSNPVVSAGRTQPADSTKAGGQAKQLPANPELKPTPARDSIAQQPAPAARRDSLAVAPAKPAAPVKEEFALHADAPYYVAIVLTKVDPVFVGEVRNAFNRYNQQNFYNQPLEAGLDEINDSVKLVLIKPFADAAAALKYSDQTSPVAASSIIPWLPKAKFRMLVINPENLALLKKSGRLADYQIFLRNAFPGKFE